jgi:general secretion pathway protein G
MRKRKQKRGFTLIEILLVIGIIAMLAAFVVPSFMGTRNKAEIDATRALIGDSGRLGTSIQTFRMHVGRWPEELKELVEAPSDETEAKKWGGPYINELKSLKDPWGSDLQYKSPGTVREDSYDLWSLGPDRQDGSTDDIKNWESDE